MNTAPHMKPWPKVARFFCARVLGHQDRNYAGPTMHYAYCLRCGYLFGNPWGGGSESDAAAESDTMRDEYDFSGSGERGKFYKREP